MDVQSHFSPNEILSNAFLNISDFEYWSYDALKNLYIGMYEMTTEWCLQCLNDDNRLKGPTRAKFTRFVNKSKKIVDHIPVNRTDLLKLIYETILRAEKKSLLPGFKFAFKVGKNKVLIDGNPEKQTLYSEITPKKLPLNKIIVKKLE